MTFVRGQFVWTWPCSAQRVLDGPRTALRCVRGFHRRKAVVASSLSPNKPWQHHYFDFTAASVLRVDSPGKMLSEHQWKRVADLPEILRLPWRGTHRVTAIRSSDLGAPANELDRNANSSPWPHSASLDSMSSSTFSSDLRTYLETYRALSKSRLAALVVLTTMAGYAMAPLTCSTSPSSLLWTTIGTALCVGSANSFNQWMEVPYDAQMQRTRNRPLVQQRVSALHAFTFAVLSGSCGVGILHQMVNPLTALLGFANIVLYAGIYTPWKRHSPFNTWIGSLVGGIPPMMGWTAVANQVDPGCWLLGAALFAWQFPHFHALSWNIREDYARAGYQMLACTDPRRNALISLLASLSLFPICVGLTAIDVTSSCFVLTSSMVNGGMAYWAWRFYRKNTNDQTARKLFRASLFHLPLLVMLMLIHKKSWPHADERKQRSLHRAVHQRFDV